VNLTSTISLLELFWTILAGAGLIIHLALVIDALQDKAALKSLRPDGPRNLIANINLWDDASRAVLQVGFMVIGLYSMLVPPNPAASQSTSAVPGLIIVALEIMLIGVSVSDLRAKAALLGMMTRYTLVETAEPLNGASIVLVPPSSPPGSVAVSHQDNVTTVQVRDKEPTHDDPQS
jgi:hypothetical protein